MFNLPICLFMVTVCQSRKLWEKAEPELIVDLSQTIAINPQTFKKIQITGLSDTLNQDFLSQFKSANELWIKGNRLKDIETGALCTSKNLKILELDLSGNRQPPLLRKRHFGNCTLEELFLKFDYFNPSKMEVDTLEDLKSLKVLGIDSLDAPTRFILPNNLKNLTLSHLQLHVTNDIALDNLTNLETLEIVHHVQLTTLPDLKNLKKLKRLNLRDNALKLTWNEFEDLDSLEELDVSDNLISAFDASKIARNMPKLRSIFIDINPIDCQHRKEFIGQLTAKLNRSLITSKFGDSAPFCIDI